MMVDNSKAEKLISCVSKLEKSLVEPHRLASLGLIYPPLEGKPVESLQVERPVAPLSFAVLLRERRDLVARHPDRNPDHKTSGLKPWLSAVGVKKGGKKQ